MVHVICLGVTGAGKTTLLKRLSASSEEQDAGKHSVVIPTVGVNHFCVKFSLEKAKSKKKNRAADDDSVEVLELGGDLAQTWTSYLALSPLSVIFVIDASDTIRLAQVAFHFVDCVAALSNKAQASILVLYSKIDLVDETKVGEKLRRIRQILQLPHLKSWYTNVDFRELQYCVWDDYCVPVIKDWIRKKGRAN